MFLKEEKKRKQRKGQGRGRGRKGREGSDRKVLASMRTHSRLHLPKTAKTASDFLYTLLVAKTRREDQIFITESKEG